MTSKQETISVDYTTQKFKISKATIKKFKTIDDERRYLRMGQVKQIAGQLDRNIHFRTSLIVNEVNNKFRIIDGNHRFEGIKRAMTRNPDLVVEVWLHVYRGLSRQREREIYHISNIGTRETQSDYLQQYWKVVPKARRLMNLFPISVYGSKTTMPVKNLIVPYFSSELQGRFGMGSHLKKGPALVDICLNLSDDHLHDLKLFWTDMEEIFGDYTRDNKWFRPNPFDALMRLWYDNRKRRDSVAVIKQVTFIKAFRKVFVRNPGLWRDLMSFGGRTAQEHFYALAIQRLNGYDKRVTWQDDQPTETTKEND